MKTEDQVVSLELAKELKELEVKQDSLWFWTWAEWNEEVEWVLISQDEAAKLRKEKFSAPTVAELGEMLPKTIDKHSLCIYKREDRQWFIHYFNDYHRSEKFRVVAKTEANARAEMLIYLIKEGIIKAEELK